MRKILILLLLSFYTSCYATGKTIGILTYSVVGVKPWDPDSVKSGITGSEESVIYMSQKLASLGYKVCVIGNPPANSPYSKSECNPRFVSFNDYPQSKFDIAIAWRMPNIAAELKSHAAKVYLWPHDTYHWHLTDEQINGFDDVLWLSEWQREQWISVNPGFKKYTQIFGNGINPEAFNSLQERSNPYSCIYGSNYARGLEVLLDIWPKVKEKYPKATLDIYYGWQHWGLLTPEKELKMRSQINLLSSQGVQEHGLVSHEEVTRAFEKASLWTYPCIMPETFCITAIRAQLSGNIPVIIEGSALKETVRHGFKCHSREEYLTTLLKAMENVEKISLDERKHYGEFVSKEYSWAHLALRWSELFEKEKSI